MSFVNNRRVSGKNVIRSSLELNRSTAAIVKRWLTRKILFPVLYHIYALKPIQQDKVIFMEIRFSELTDSYQEIFNELIRNYDMDIHCHFFRQGFVTPKNELKRQIDFIKDAATAKYLIYNDSSDTQGSFKVRKGTHVLNTWHACGAFKKFGFSTMNKIFGGTEKEKATYGLHPEYDLVTVSSPEIEWAYVEAMGKEKNPGCVKATGISRTDVFYRQSFIDAAYNHLYDVMPQARGKKVILYAPTFRGSARLAVTPDMLDVGVFYEKFSEDYVMIFKHHPLVKMRPSIPVDYRKFAVDLTPMMSISELLCVADICITDYSSLIFEYSIFEKPMIFFAYDLANYFDWRGFYYNYDELTPGPVCYTNSEMVEYIEHLDERFDVEKVRAFRDKFMSSCDGHATERIMEQFFGNAIDKYKRQTPITGEYHTIPEVNTFKRDEDARLKKMKKVMKKGAAAYNKAVHKDIIKGRIALLADESSDWDVFLAFEKALEKSGKNYDIVRDIVFNEDNVAGFMEKLARAEFIVCAGEPYILRMINVRKETKQIQICPELLPLYPKWKNSKEVRSGYKTEECRLFPIHSEYSAIMGGAAPEEEFLKQNYTLADGGKVYNIGNITLDMLFDNEFKKNAMDRLNLVCPYTKGKKIILFMGKDRDSLTSYLNQIMTAMHEKFARDYVCLGMACDGRPGIRMEIAEYLEGFGVDPKYVLGQRVAQQDANTLDVDEASGIRFDEIDWKKFPPITLVEACAIADVVIGDYASQTMAAVVAEKPLFLWAPDRVTYGKAQEMYMDYEKLLPELMVSGAKDLVEKIENVDKYDMSIIRNFRDRYLPGNDGKASERLEAILGELN